MNRIFDELLLFTRILSISALRQSSALSNDDDDDDFCKSSSWEQAEWRFNWVIVFKFNFRRDLNDLFLIDRFPSRNETASTLKLCDGFFCSSYWALQYDLRLHWPTKKFPIPTQKRWPMQMPCCERITLKLALKQQEEKHAAESKPPLLQNEALILETWRVESNHFEMSCKPSSNHFNL